MPDDRVFGSVDRFLFDPDTGSQILAGWASDAADPHQRGIVVRFIEHGAAIGTVAADLPRDDGFQGYAVRCDGANLAARAAAGLITAVAQTPDGREGILKWHPPFVEKLKELAAAPPPPPAEIALRRDDRATTGALYQTRILPDGLEIASGGVHLRIVAVRADIVRVRMAATADWADDVSWAVLDTARQAGASVRPLQEPDAVGFATNRLIVRVLRATGQMMITRADGVPVCLDAADVPPELQRGGFTLRKQRLPGEHYFGLGDQPGPLDRSGGSFVLWNTDTGNYQEATTPMYKSVPFYIAARHGAACGILLDNSWRSVFDFGHTKRDAVTFGAEGGPADYYVLAGRDTRAVLEAYAYLTGLPPLPPLWALGYHQSRYSYMTQEAVLAVADGLRGCHFPADAVHCDIDYLDQNRPFTVNTATFPDFPGMVATLSAHNLRVVAITDLHIAAVAADYAPYASGLEGGHFLTTPAGQPAVGASHPGPAVFPDFTRTATRNWWGALYTGLVEAGVAGFWNDMNEPAVANATGTLPLDTVHRIEEPGYPYRVATHAELHNVVGLQNVRATYDGVLALRPDERPFVLTRASFAGGQRYAWTWTGDNSATWNHLRLTTPMILNAGLSGMGFIGSDVGGFFGDCTPELLTRWYQLAAFHPFFRAHCFQDSAAREPWLDGPQHAAIRRRFVETRYRLLPYLYTLAEEASRTGVPMLRPLFLELPAMLGTANNFRHAPDAQFMLGAALMVAPPPFLEAMNPYDVALPNGPWYDFWTGRPVNAPMAHITPTLGTLPVFVRAGSILPQQALVQSTAETPDGPLLLSVFPGRPGFGTVYADDGHTLAYQRGEYLRLTFRFADQPDGGYAFTLSAREGSHQPWWKTIEIAIHSMPNRPVTVTAEHGQVLRTVYDPGRTALVITLADPGIADVIRIVPQQP